ncbi:MAG: lipoprotein-releasing system transmembrane subunit LolC [Rhodospirillaceae bacterium]|nr:lipoprotein-releasing system transmembrane subunit LolC [Rhodospirillaceae bacterium]
MFRPIELFIGLRYVQARASRGFVSFISMASMLGIGLGVASLIVILSVMNGFEEELRTRLLSMTAHASISEESVGIDNWRSLREGILEIEGVDGVSPFVTLEGMLGSGANLSPVIVRGVMPFEEAAVSQLEQFFRVRSLSDLQPDSNRIVLGRILAINLGVGIGDQVNLVVPRVENGRLMPRLNGFVVSGIFEAGIQDHDVSLALVHLNKASQIKGLQGRSQGLAIRMEDPFQVLGLQNKIRATKFDLQYSDWTLENSNYFRAIKIEKLMMTILLLLIVAVAAFNIVASLVMMVTDKTKDIAILRTYGFSSADVARVFMIQGSFLGLVGILIGVFLGMVLAFNVETIVPWLESVFNFQIMPGDVYYVTQIPSDVRFADVVIIPLLAFIVTVVATIYPSRRAAAIAPAEALRYE